MALDRLDHHDGVVDDEADRENETEQGQRIDRKAERREQDERAHRETGTASSGMSVARQPCRKRKTTRITRTIAINSV